MKRLALVSLAALSFTACGSSGVAATATKGDSFCKLAQVAKDDNDTLSSIDFTDAAKVKLELPAAIDSLSAAAAKAPKDIADTAKQLLAVEEQFEKVLKADNYDFAKMSESVEGKKAIDDLSKSTIPKEFKQYLQDKCGIAPTDSAPTDTVVGQS